MSACYAFTDVEATGLDQHRNGVLTLSSFITDKDYNLLDEIHLSFRPDGSKEKVWSEHAQKVHGITWEEAMEFPPMQESCEAYVAFLAKLPPLAFVAHNVSYDRRMIRGTLGRFDLHFQLYKTFPRYQDTLRLIKESGLVKSKSKSLGAICQELGIEHTHHDAKSDARVLIDIHKLCTTTAGNEAAILGEEIYE